MRYLIDSDVLVDYLDGVETAVRLVGSLDSDGMAMGVVTYMEVYQGIVRAPITGDVRDRFDAFVATTAILSFTPPVARRCAHLREELRRRGRPVRSRYLDLVNAATALEYDLILLTRNVADYDDIPGLRLL